MLYKKAKLQKSTIFITFLDFFNLNIKNTNILTFIFFYFF